MGQGDRVTYSPSIVHGYSHLPMVGASLNLTFVYLNFVDEAAIMEQYGNEVGLAALEWCGPRIQTIQLDN